jgi:hypothetical protein
MQRVTSGLLVFFSTPCWQGKYSFMFSGTLETVPIAEDNLVLCSSKFKSTNSPAGYIHTFMKLK